MCFRENGIVPDRRGGGKKGSTPPAIGWKADVTAPSTCTSAYPPSPPPSWEETQAARQNRHKSPQRNKKGSKSLPNSPTKTKGGMIPRAPSFPNSPDKKTRTHRGHMYIEVPDSLHVEKETVL